MKQERESSAAGGGGGSLSAVSLQKDAIATAEEVFSPIKWLTVSGLALDICGRKTMIYTIL